MTPILRLVGVVCLSILATAFTRVAHAGTILGSGPSGGTRSLFDIETTPFSATVIGPTSGQAISGMDIQPGTGLLFGSSGFTGTHPGSLFNINPATGAATFIATVGDGSKNVPAIAFDNDGTLYASYDLTNLATVNPVDGSVAVIGSFTGVIVEGMAIDPTSGVLYGITYASDILGTINKSTGLFTAIGQITNPSVDQFFVSFSGLAFDGDGNLYASAGGQAPVGSPYPGIVVSIDQTTLLYTIIGDANNGAITDIVVVPEPSTLVVILCVMMAPMAKRRRGGARR